MQKFLKFLVDKVAESQYYMPIEWLNRPFECWQSIEKISTRL